MGILDGVKSVPGSSEGDSQNGLMSTIMNLIGGQSGGLNGFISQLTSKGLGDKVSSWVGTGKNLPVSPDEITNALGSAQINNIAAKLGMDKNEVTSRLSNMLPQVVDKLTPDGKVPEGDILSKGMSMLGGLFGKK